MINTRVEILVFSLLLCFLLTTPLSFATYDRINSYGEKLVLHGDFYYDPESYDFGKMLEGRTDTTTIRVWARIGCNVPSMAYKAYSDFSWLSISPENGVTSGEIDYLTVEIDTTSLKIGNNIGEVVISGNLGIAKIKITVEIVENTPIIKIRNIKGGICGITADIINEGDKPAENVYWSIMINRGFLDIVPRDKNGDISSLAIDEKKVIRSKRFIKLGEFTITIDSGYNNIQETGKITKGYGLGLFILV